MTGINIDPERIAGYARTVSRTGAELGGARDALKAAPLPADTFGQLGAQSGVAQSYAQAAQALSDQLNRAVDALNSAARGLAKVAEHYGSHDQDMAALITRAGGR